MHIEFLMLFVDYFRLVILSWFSCNERTMLPRQLFYKESEDHIVLENENKFNSRVCTGL